MPIAALFSVAVLALIGTSWFLNRDALRQAVEAQIREVTGLDLIVTGAIDVSVFPGSYVSFHNVGLKGGGTADPATHRAGDGITRPRAAGRCADREPALAAIAAAPL